MLDHIHSIQVQSLELLYVVFFYSIESFYTTWNCFWITAYKTSNNVLQISCCEFEYFSINKRYTSRRRQRNERTKSQNEPARIWGAVIHGLITTSTTEYVPLRSVLRGSICHFQSNLLGQLHMVQPLSSDSSFHLVPWIWIRLWLSYDLLFFSEN